MLPRAGTRKWKFRKLGASGYVDWLNGILGKEVTVEGRMSRKQIDELMIDVIETPPWVEAALDSLKKKEVVEEVDGIEPSSEDEEEVVEEIHEEIQEEEIEEAPLEVVEEVAPPEPEPEKETVIISVEQPFVAVKDYNSMTVRELREVCKERNITVRGTKSEVVLRLNRYDDGIMESAATDEADAPSEEAVDAESDAPSEEAVTTGDENADSRQGDIIDEEE